jgi:hypothetical protein
MNKPPMRQTANKVTTTRNAYGDYVAGAKTILPCHFRYITNIDRASNSEAINSDAMAWFEADSNVVKGNVFIIDDEGFIVDKVIKARRLRDPTVLFLKTELSKYGVIS